MTHHHTLATAADASRFVLAGDAVLTLTSRVTGQRYTYSVVAAKDRGKRTEHPTLYFVSLLSGPDNDADYTYIGSLRITLAGPRFDLTQKSRLPADAKPIAAFRFFVQRVLAAGVMPPLLEVRHEGRCGRCGRRLTVPESIDTGLGTECADRLGVPWQTSTAPLADRLAQRLAA